ncbi:MAG: hypothetical protein H6581_11050 [Bacteroidia bacterium]|nr:hypothetical protein [Bacteroidia bacterium]
MAKKFTIKKNRLRSRTRRRNWMLKIGAPVIGKNATPEEKNRSVIDAIEAKMKA